LSRNAPGSRICEHLTARTHPDPLSLASATERGRRPQPAAADALGTPAPPAPAREVLAVAA